MDINVVSVEGVLATYISGALCHVKVSLLTWAYMDKYGCMWYLQKGFWQPIYERRISAAVFHSEEMIRAEWEALLSIHTYIHTFLICILMMIFSY